jgi:predicted nucleic acid-binding protein
MKLFVDTSAWLAIHDKNDQFHKQAVEKNCTIKSRRIDLVTSEYVLDESITLIRFRVSHTASVIFGESLFHSSIINIVYINTTERQKAWDFFKKHKDKEFSFTDGTSFIIMKTLNIKKAFTFDSHFNQIGFELF